MFTFAGTIKFENYLIILSSRIPHKPQIVSFIFKFIVLLFGFGVVYVNNYVLRTQIFTYKRISIQNTHFIVAVNHYSITYQLTEGPDIQVRLTGPRKCPQKY